MPEGPRIDKPQTVAPKPHTGGVARSSPAGFSPAGGGASRRRS